MIRNILNQRFASNLDYARRLIEGLSEEQGDHAPAAGMNTPRWVVGHLAQTADKVTLGLLFAQPRTLEGWDAWFDGGTYPGPHAPGQPTLAAALAELERLHDAVTAAVAGQTPDWFERSVPETLPAGFRERFPTTGTALAHTMLIHEMQHLGQLSAWRRVLGLPAV